MKAVASADLLWEWLLEVGPQPLDEIALCCDMHRVTAYRRMEVLKTSGRVREIEGRRWEAIEV